MGVLSPKRMPHKSVPKASPTKVSHKSVAEQIQSLIHECSARVSHTSVPHVCVCGTRVPFRKSIAQECQAKVSRKHVLQNKCQIRVSPSP